MTKQKINPNFSLDSHGLKKVGKGALIAVTGAILTYGTQEIVNINFGEWTPVVVAIWSVIANLGHKWITKYHTK